jgi:hypothetical protein
MAASNRHSSKVENQSNAAAFADVPSELRPLKLCIFKRLQLSAVNSHCSHMRSRHSDLMLRDEDDQTALAGTRHFTPAH